MMRMISAQHYRRPADKELRWRSYVGPTKEHLRAIERKSEFLQERIVAKG